MFPLGHLGLGLESAKPFDRGLPRAPLLFGTLLPDLIDKPLYYFLTPHVVAGTRSFGHTFLFTLSLAALARLRRSRALMAVALGCATHLFLDFVTDVAMRAPGFSMKAFLWPLLGWGFPDYTFHNWHDHLLHVREPFLLTCEIVGAALLLAEWRRSVRAAAGRR